MNSIPKKLISKFRHFCGFMLVFLLAICFSVLKAQTNSIEIVLVDTLAYTHFGLKQMSHKNYPPSHLFDSNVKTCWVSAFNDHSVTKPLYIRVPDISSDSMIINIFSGYGKSESLYNKNSRPKEIQLTYYSAYLRDGHVSENAYQCEACQLPIKQIISLKDTFGVQRFQLLYNTNNFVEHQKRILENRNIYNNSVIDTFSLVKLEIMDVWEGDKYKDDICISEIYFNDCYMSHIKNSNYEIKRVYLNAEENELLIEKADTTIAVYTDKASVLQNIQLSDDRKWAILIAMPAERAGRTETSYLVVDIVAKKVINQELTHYFSGYNLGDPIFLKECNGEAFLIYDMENNETDKIKLRHLRY